MVLLGLVVEGGHLSSIVGLAAFMIVLGGAFGASLLDTPWDKFKEACKMLVICFRGPRYNYNALVDQLTRLAAIARKDGLLALEKERDNIDDPLLRDALKFAIDGLEPNLVASILEARINYRMELSEGGAKYFLNLASYCPTMGILGAVLGLIHVMENLSNPAAIGPGIATAFIATVYGVGSCYLLFMPIGNKVRSFLPDQENYYEMIKVGVKDIQQGTSPRIMAAHLMAIIDKEGQAD